MVKIAVIPVAGFGTRMLPASKSIPKEMLPLADKPMIHFIFDECINAGIEHIILVSHSTKTCLEDYFDRNFELEQQLSSSGKIPILKEIQKVSDAKITVTTVRQRQALGLGHAVYCAQKITGSQPFAVLLPDVLLPEVSLSGLGKRPKCNILSEMIYRNKTTGANQVLVEPVEESLISNYGVIAGDFLGDENSQSIEINQIVEKPPSGEAPSNLAVVGRYVFNASIMDYLKSTSPGIGGEIQLTDAIMQQIKNESVQGFKMIGHSRDCGSKLGYYKAFVEQVLSSGNRDSEVFRQWLHTQASVSTTESNIVKNIKLVV